MILRFKVHSGKRRERIHLGIKTQPPFTVGPRVVEVEGLGAVPPGLLRLEKRPSKPPLLSIRYQGGNTFQTDISDWPLPDGTQHRSQTTAANFVRIDSWGELDRSSKKF
ncbi:hypothetical protein V2G26_005622 [Clonostachys chloroleuca]